MSIPFTCLHCGQKMTADDSQAGEQAMCPGCGKATMVPAKARPPKRPEPPEAGKRVPPAASSPPLTPSSPPPLVPPSAPPLVPPSAPPPMPPRPGSPGRAPRAGSILEGYRQTAAPARPGWRAGLARVFRATKGRAQAMKVRHEIKSLRTAFEQQLESLGLLTLEHRPSQVDMTGELAELSGVQGRLSERQSTLASLHQTKGSGAVVRQLRREEAVLRDRQRELMIAIGRKAHDARPELPGAAGHYGALDQLRTSQQAKEAELAELEERLGPVFDGRGPGFTSLKKPLLIGGGVVAGLVVLYLLVRLMMPGGLPRWTRYYIPDDAKGLAYIDLDELRDSPFSEDVETLTGGLLGFIGSLDLDQEDIREIFAVASEEGQLIVALRTEEDADLEDVVEKMKGDAETFKDREYARSGVGPTFLPYVAKTDKRTFCLAATEEAMKDLLRQLDRGEKAELDEDLERALHYVSGKDHYFAAVDVNSEMAAVAGAISVGSSVKAKGIAIFKKERDAEEAHEDAMEELEDEIDRKEEALEDADGKEAERIESELHLLHGISLSRSGDSMRFSGKWDSDVLIEMGEEEGVLGLDSDEARQMMQRLRPGSLIPFH